VTAIFTVLVYIQILAPIFASLVAKDNTPYFYILNFIPQTQVLPDSYREICDNTHKIFSSQTNSII